MALVLYVSQTKTIKIKPDVKQIVKELMEEGCVVRGETEDECETLVLTLDTFKQVLYGLNCEIICKPVYELHETKVVFGGQKTLKVYVEGNKHNQYLTSSSSGK